MAVPKKKISVSRRNQRRSHDRLKRGNVVECTNCGELKRPHHVCESCGQYGDHEVTEPADVA